MHLSDYLSWKKLSDEQFASEIKCSRATVSRIRRRKVRPDWETIAKIKSATGGKVTADDFVRMQAAE